MNRENFAVGRPELTEVQEQFRSWRRSRKRGSRIPQKLWQAAAELSGHHSIGRIALTLGLDHMRLKQRVESMQAMRARMTLEELRPAGASGQFVEMEMAPERGHGECNVEAEDGKGKKLKMHLKGSGCTEAVEIVKALWGLGR